MADATDRLRAVVILLEELLIALVIGVLVILVVADVASFLGRREMSPFDHYLYRSLGKWAVVALLWVEVSLIAAAPVGLLSGLLYSRRGILYTAIPAVVFLAAFSVFSKGDLTAIACALVIATAMVAAAALGTYIDHPWRIPNHATGTPVSGARWLCRAIADVLLCLFVVANIVIWREVIIGSERSHKFTVGFFSFLIISLSLAAIGRFLLREPGGSLAYKERSDNA